MHIYVSQGEIAIEGNINELRNISEYVRRAKIGSLRSYSLSQVATAEHYDCLLEEFILECNGSKIKGSITEKTLKLEFAEEFSGIVASYFEFEDGFVAGYHHHFDKYGNENYWKDESIDMVVQVSRFDRVGPAEKRINIRKVVK